MTNAETATVPCSDLQLVLSNDLQLVREFLRDTVGQAAGQEVPEPAGVQLRENASLVRQWVDLLDMAVTPEMLRLALGNAPDGTVAAALLRYYVSKSPARGAADAKLECVTASVARLHFGTEAAQTSPVVGFSSFRISQVLTDLERQFHTLLQDLPQAELSQEARTLAADLDALCQEAGTIRNWEQWAAAGLLPRLAAIRTRLDSSLSHPRALATLALLAVVLEHRLDFLAGEAAFDLGAFAARIRNRGGELVWLEHNEQAIQGLQRLAQSTAAQQPLAERLQELTELRESRAVRRRATAEVAAPAAGCEPAAELVPAKSVAEVEENRLADLRLSIRTALRKFEPGQDVKLKLPACTVALSATEADSFRNEYEGEKSFRADYGNALRQMVLLHTRIDFELERYKEKIDSTYLWQAHANALEYLVSFSGPVLQAVISLLTAAEQRGLLDRVAVLSEARQKLLLSAQEARDLLQQRASPKAGDGLPEQGIAAEQAVAAVAVAALH